MMNNFRNISKCFTSFKLHNLLGLASFQSRLIKMIFVTLDLNLNKMFNMSLTTFQSDICVVWFVLHEKLKN